MAEVRLKDVTKIYENGFKAVKNAVMEIHDREFMVLVGPSGCGKSTTLRMVAGLEDVSSGRIFIGDRDVTNLAPKDRDIAMVFQNYALYPHMTCFDNMAFALKIRRMARSEIESKVLESARILGIEALLDRKPRQLSGGQRQRVAVGRAIVRNPKVFLFDEPLSNLDAKLRVQMRAEISRLHNRLESTMIYVTHDQTEAMTMGDRIVVMLDGDIQQIDTPLRLYHHPVNRFVAGFIGSPPMNFVRGRLIKADGAFLIRGEGVEIPLNEAPKALLSQLDRELEVGFRPESAALDPQSGELAARVDVVEPMGAETYIHLKVAGASVTVRVPGDAQVRYDDRVYLRPQPDRLHFFDLETGMAIV